MDFDFDTDSLGKDEAGNDVFLKDIWPNPVEVQQVIDDQVNDLLQLRLGQAGEVGPVSAQQVGATVGAAVGHDRNAGATQGVEVAADGAAGHLQPVRQVARAQAAVGLEQEQDREQAVGTHKSEGSSQIVTIGVIYRGAGWRA